jgi:acyl dehydratase
MTTRELDRSPARLPLLAKAIVPALPVVGSLPGVRRSGGPLPDLELVQRGIAVDAARLTAYSKVCGFGPPRTVPATYPHVLAFPLLVALMTDPRFPFVAVGTVHVENRIVQHRPLAVDEVLDLAVRLQNLRPHEKGQQFDFSTSASVGGEVVWEEVSTYLHRAPTPTPRAENAETSRPATPRAENAETSGDASPRAENAETSGDASPRAENAETSRLVGVEAPPGATSWRLGADLGRRYAAVSGDVNPIHLYRLAAKAFGFPRQIAHGMWSTARCLAALQPRLPDTFELTVSLRKPVLLPGTVSFGARADGDGWVFGLRDAKEDRLHLVGTARPR